jgi:hypothetical protein
MARPKKYPEGHRFVRNCSTCNIEIIYATSSQYYSAERLNRKCRKCGSGWARGQTKETNKSLAKMGKSVSKKLKGRPTWNKGLTKETHSSLKVIGDKIRGRKHSPDTIKKISAASKNHWNNTEYRELVSRRVKETRGAKEVVDKWRQTGENNGKFTPLEQKSDWEKYAHEVWYHTNKNDLSKLDNHNLRGRIDLVENAYHLDHIVSITDGFNNKVDPEIIGSIYNLRFIPAHDNMRKKQSSDMSIQKLQRLWKENINEEYK